MIKGSIFWGVGVGGDTIILNVFVANKGMTSFKGQGAEGIKREMGKHSSWILTSLFNKKADKKKISNERGFELLK